MFITRKFLSSNIAPFTVFQSTGMLMARPVPLQFTETDQTIAREGYVSLTVIPRTLDESSEKTSFDKEKKLSVKLRAKQIGQLLSWKINGSKLAPLTVNTYMSGSVPATMELKFLGNNGNSEDPEVQLTITPKSGDHGPVSMPISVGEIKSFQVLLESCLPELYGWTSRTTAPKLGGTWSRQSSETKSPEDFFNQFKK